MHPVRVNKPNFIFGRMHVNIDLVKRNPDENHGHRKLPFDQALRKSCKNTVLDGSIAHKTVIDKNIQPPGCPARNGRRANPTRNGYAVAL